MTYKPEKKIYKKMPEEDWLNELNSLILLHMEKDQFNMDFLGKKMDTSRRHLQRKIKKITGQTPKEYVNELRLQESLRLLENREINSIKVLANKIGFSSTDYFTTLFKRRFGRVPSSFLMQER